MPQEVDRIYKVGIYCRLSKEDGGAESSSIETQKAILSAFVSQKRWKLVQTYIDDGYSGTNFKRPSFQAMIQDIEAGLIDCVITKDLSRLGRNYLDCGLYLEVFFPEHGVRYIAVNDGVDTVTKTAMDITPFRNILNEMYSADVSVKIKSAYKARFHAGKFMAASAPYGYLKDPEDRNHLIVDEKVAHVVRKMFALALEGNGIAKIRHYLNASHILRPAAYAVEKGGSGYERYFTDSEANRYIWSENSVRGILRSPIYAGNLCGYKRPSLGMKSKKRPARPPEEWEVTPGTHEAIISQTDFDIVQRLMTSRRKKNVYDYDNVLCGLVKCADCGYAMCITRANRIDRPEMIDCMQYCCTNYGRYGNINCSSHTIEARDLVDVVLADINHYAALAVQDERAVKILQQKLNTVSASDARAYEKEKRKLTKRQSELNRLFSALYEDKVMEKITERNYGLLSAKYEQEQTETDTRLKVIEAELVSKGRNDAGVQDFLSAIGGYRGITTLTAAMVNALIDKITISERRVNEAGENEQTVTIYYKFVGALNEHTVHPTRMERAKAVTVCQRCGAVTLRGSNAAKYCPDCSLIVHRIKSNASKKRSLERAKERAKQIHA